MWIIGVIFLLIIMIAIANGSKKPKYIGGETRGYTGDRKPEDTIRTKVVGVTFENDDGSSRQEVIENCIEGEEIILVHAPSKRFPEALEVHRTNNEQLGHINAELAHDLLQKFNAGYNYAASILEVTGGDEDRPTYGCNIEIDLYK
jgi:hypothetical protein